MDELLAVAGELLAVVEVLNLLILGDNVKLR